MSKRMLIATASVLILTAITMPRYQDMSPEVRERTGRSALHEMITGIVIFYANEAVETGIASWPSIDELRTVGIVMEHGIPENPYQAVNYGANKIVIGNTKGVVVDEYDINYSGWVYNPETGDIWLNTSTDDVKEYTW